MELNNGPSDWTRFVQLIQIRFGPPLTDSPIGEVALLQHAGSVDDYCKQFMALSCHDLVISEVHQIQLFTASLGKPLRTDVSLQKPEMLGEAIMYARAYEQWDHAPQALAVPVAAIRLPGRSVARQPALLALAAPAGSSASSSSSVHNKPTPSLKLSSSAIAERKKTCQCFHCDDMYVPGHHDMCKHLFVIKVLGDDEVEPPATGDPMISLHVLTGI
jgi:hypothetical protein